MLLWDLERRRELGATELVGVHVDRNVISNGRAYAPDCLNQHGSGCPQPGEHDNGRSHHSGGDEFLPAIAPSVVELLCSQDPFVWSRVSVAVEMDEIDPHRLRPYPAAR